MKTFSVHYSHWYVVCLLHLHFYDSLPCVLLCVYTLWNVNRSLSFWNRASLTSLNYSSGNKLLTPNVLLLSPLLFELHFNVWLDPILLINEMYWIWLKEYIRCWHSSVNVKLSNVICGCLSWTIWQWFWEISILYHVGWHLELVYLFHMISKRV